MASVSPISPSESTLRPIPPALAAESAPSTLSVDSHGLVPSDAAERGMGGHLSEGNSTRSLGDEQELDPMPAIFLPLPVAVSVAIPLRNFRVRNLLAMSAGTVLETQWAHGEDMPLASGDVQLAWTEFEVIETQLAVRVTRLA
jgi:flagellar motor switch/type III secretory pathway protein FliN